MEEKKIINLTGFCGTWQCKVDEILYMTEDLKQSHKMFYNCYIKDWWNLVTLTLSKINLLNIIFNIYLWSVASLSWSELLPHPDLSGFE